MIEFTTEDRKLSPCQIIEQGIDLHKFEHKELPSDVHVVTYEFEGNKFHDAVRAYTKTDIFDMYYDKISKAGKVLSIQSGFGSIRPNLYGKIKPE